MAEDFNKLRLLVKSHVRAKFKSSFLFRLEIEGQPEDMDIFVKDITYGPTEVTNEPIKIGGRVLTYPTQAEPVSLSTTVRDDEDEKIAQFFDEWAAKVVNDDGTLNLPFGDKGYVKKVKRFAQMEDGKEVLKDTWEMFPQQRGDVTESREEGGFLEFPLTFIQFRS